MEEAVSTYLESVTPAKRQRDARTLLDLIGKITQLPPTMWGSIIGFGSYHYRYGSGREGDAPAAGFAARKAATTIYLPDGVGAHADLLAELGPHTTGVGCLYIKDLDKAELSVLETIISRSFATVTDGDSFGQRARDSSATT